MQYSNLHTHTIFSDGTNMPEEMALAAIEKGMVSLGFSDHSRMEHDTSYCMRSPVLPAYRREVRRLQEKYAGQIEIYLVIELDGLSPESEREGYDYVLGDLHYVSTPDGYFSVDTSRELQYHILQKYFGGDSTAFSRNYFEGYVEAIERMRPDILGHFDLTTKYGYVDEDDPAYRAAAVEALTACLSVTSLVELNTGAIARRLRTTPYPAAFLLKEIRDRGGRIVLSSDCHAAENLTCHFDESLALLREIGFRSVAVLKGGQFTDVGIV